MHFTKSGTTDYVATKGPARDLLQVSCEKIEKIVIDSFIEFTDLTAVCLPVVAIVGYFQLRYDIIVRNDVLRQRLHTDGL